MSTQQHQQQQCNPCTYCGVLFYAYKNGRKVLLLGREAIVDKWHSSGKLSDFGGSPEKGETSSETAIRECYQETMGVLGCTITLKSILDTGKALYVKSTNATIYLVNIRYDENLPNYFNNIYNYLTKCQKDHPDWTGFKYIPSCPEGFVEKTEMIWVLLDDIINEINKIDSGQQELEKSIYRSSFIESLKEIIETDSSFNDSLA